MAPGAGWPADGPPDGVERVSGGLHPQDGSRSGCLLDLAPVEHQVLRAVGVHLVLGVHPFPEPAAALERVLAAGGHVDEDGLVLAGTDLGLSDVASGDQGEE